jgi:glycosyltransferase involved in cell wall biosynthesis
VSYDVDGAREVVISNETGFLIPPRDVAQLAEKLKLLAGDAAMRDRFGQEGRQRFTEVFRHEHMTAQLRELYQNILCKAATSGRGPAEHPL